jgi:hypothetical protein
MEVPSESFKGELGIEEPVILCEPRILTVNQWLADTKTNRCGSSFLRNKMMDHWLETAAGRY